jgi:DNA-binding NarL/FixJ family response regulator
MPDLLRLALAAGDHERAERALEIAKMEAAREKTPARAHTALQRCQALIDGDPEPLLAVADHYRTVGRSVEMAATLADAAVLFAQRDQAEYAQHALAAAVTTFTDLGAALDIARVEDRLRRYGIHRTAPTDDHPAVVRWRGLSEAEQRIAGLVAVGRTNTDIAGELALSRRTVQLHLSHIMRKLGAGSRAELVTTVSTALATSRPDASTTVTS